MDLNCLQISAAIRMLACRICKDSDVSGVILCKSFYNICILVYKTDLLGYCDTAFFSVTLLICHSYRNFAICRNCEFLLCRYLVTVRCLLFGEIISLSCCQYALVRKMACGML